ncbi:hypothetical protein KCP71_12535 [Salmonella enterica subsp. enterica]|nr:hypothetical protein KCP71_12535 [Salmonella enterica subsp. enterica]
MRLAIGNANVTHCCRMAQMSAALLCVNLQAESRAFAIRQKLAMPPYPLRSSAALNQSKIPISAAYG